MIYRKPARYLSIKKRFLALTSQEKVSAKYYKRNAMIALILKGNNSNIGEQQRNELFELVFKISFIKYLSIVKEDGEAIPPTIRLNGWIAQLILSTEVNVGIFLNLDKNICIA